MQEVLAKAKEAMTKAQETQAKYANQRRREVTFKTGEQVLLSTTELNLKALGQSKKLLPKFIGPFTVSQVISDNAYKLELPSQYRRLHPVFNVSRLRAYNESDPSKFPTREKYNRPLPQLEEEEDGYEVESVLDKCRIRASNGRLVDWYLIKWAGYPASDATWKPAAHLRPPHAGPAVWHDVIAPYNASHPAPARVETAIPAHGNPEPEPRRGRRDSGRGRV